MDIKEFYEQDAETQLRWIHHDLLLYANTNIPFECSNKLIEYRYRIGMILRKMNTEK